MDSVRIKTEALLLMLAETTLSDPSIHGVPCQDGVKQGNCIVASKAIGEKEKNVPVDKTGWVWRYPVSQGKDRHARVSKQHDPHAWCES
jgi:hypothetical protein